MQDLGSLASLPHGSDQEGKKRKSIGRMQENKNFYNKRMGIVCLKKAVCTVCTVHVLYKRFRDLKGSISLPCCHLPCGSWLDMAWVGAACAGGLSLPGQEGLTRAGISKSVFSRLLLHRHTL